MSRDVFGFSFQPSQLLSRIVRANASQGKSGIAVIQPTSEAPKPRKLPSLTKFDDGEAYVIPKLPWPLGFINDAEKLINKVRKNPFIVVDGAKWLLGQALGLLNFSASKVWSWVLNGINFIKQFDWNATDDALRQGNEGRNTALASIWGSVVGQGLGWLVGIGIGYGISFLCPVIGGAALARTIALKTSQEASEEVLPALYNALGETVKTFAANQLTEGYIAFRQMLKKAPKGLLETIYGKDTASFIQNVWGSKGGPNMSFNYQVEQFVEGISDKNVQAFVEALLEESWDSFTEAGFIVAMEIDNAYAQAKQQSKFMLGEERSVTITPDKEAKEETLSFINVPQKLLVPQVQQAINTQRLVHNRDMGTYVGYPSHDYVMQQPQPLRLVITMFSKKEPPYPPGTKKVTLTVPNPQRAAIKWNIVKLAIGGANGYLWGRFRCTIRFKSGSKITAYGATEIEAQETANALAAMTVEDLPGIAGVKVTEELKKGQRLKNPRLQKDPTRIYPGYFTIFNREELLTYTEGHPRMRASNYELRQARFDLWRENEPANFDEVIQRVLLKGF
jgi:hypothetical protein